MRSVNIPMEELVKLLREQLSSGVAASLRVTGSSMHPMLRNRRDSVLLAPVSEPLKKGDIILYRRQNGQYVLHRIVRTNDKLTCCGDNQWRSEQIDETQVIAAVSGFTRGDKTYAVTHTGYRCYRAVWTAIYPIRRPLIALRRSLGKLRRAISVKTV